MCYNEKMILYSVIWNGQLIAVYSCLATATECATGLYGSSIVECRLNDLTDAGKRLTQNPA